jgi:ABC-type Fe3+/spermidine/putrescine transport system ATPase subunit
MASIKVQDLHQSFGSFQALKDINLEISEGEFFSLLGASGSGKTSLLRIIAGFELPTQGCVFINGREVTRLPPEKRGIGMVFQNYALFPHLSVFDNIAYGLRANGVSRLKIAERVEEMLDLVDLPGFGHRDVHSLSGGQQQRVALARAVALLPRVLLMDEPLSNLDARLRIQTRTQLRDLQRRLGITTLYVTHDQSEAMALSDRIAVLQEGEVLQVGTPQEVYQQPRGVALAEFMGEMNLIPCELMQRNAEGKWHIEFLGKQLAVPVTVDEKRFSKGMSVVAGIRPEALGPDGHFREKREGVLQEIQYEGERWRLWVECAEVRLTLSWPAPWLKRTPQVGSSLPFSFDPAFVNVFPA